MQDSTTPKIDPVRTCGRLARVATTSADHRLRLVPSTVIPPCLQPMQDTRVQLSLKERSWMPNRRVDIAVAAHLILVPGTTVLHPEETVLAAMLTGWTHQMRSRLLAPGSIGPRIATVRRFCEFTNEYPWRWSPSDLEEWTSSLVSEPRPLAHSTVRSYQLWGGHVPLVADLHRVGAEALLALLPTSRIGSCGRPSITSTRVQPTRPERPNDP